MLKIKKFWMWRHVFGRVIADVSKDRSTITFSCSGTIWRWKLRHYSLSKGRELHTQLHGVTIQKARIFWKSRCSRMLPGSSLGVECLISFLTCENLEYYKSRSARLTQVLLLAQSPLCSLRDENLHTCCSKPFLLFFYTPRQNGIWPLRNLLI